MIQKNLVSTIIPVYNRPEMVVEAIESVLAQTYRPIEIIVVNDGSTDETSIALSSLAKTHREIKVYSQKNSGPGVARELGRQKAAGEFIQYLDSDDLLLPDKFVLQVNGLKQNPDCSVAYGKTESTLLGESLSGVAMRQTATHFKTMFPQFLRDRWWGTSTPLYRASILHQIGAWLPTLNEEDWEYDCRIASSGGKLVFIDEFVSNARRHNAHLSSQGSTDSIKLKHRCIARQKIYQHAQAYMNLEDRESEINHEDWSYFSKSVFLLARQCAMAKMPEQALQMVELSVAANQGATLQHRLFCIIASIFGWRNASLLAKWVGK